MRDTSKLFAVAALILSGAALGIAVAAGGSSDAPSGPPCPTADGHARKLRDCLSGSLAFIETDLATGSGLLLPGGFIVTDAHVVDPFSSVDVSLDGGESFDDVGVIGVDAFADIALLGPIDIDRPGIRIDPLPAADGPDDTDVFLVGYPGEVGTDDLHMTLSSGLISRVREDSSFGLTYLQTDAAIGGGQSGGALVDGEGRVLGISGLSFADEFALALSADDVLRAVQRIKAGDGDERHVMPPIDAGSAPVPIALTADVPSAVVLIPAESKDREVRLELGTSDDVAVTVSTFLGGPISMNDAAMHSMDESFGGTDVFPDSAPFDPFEGIDELKEESPGTYLIDAPADEDLLVYLDRVDDVDLVIDASGPFDAVATVEEGRTVSIDSTTRGVIDGLVTSVIHPVELKAGDRVEITVRGGASDPFFTLLAPGEVYDPYGMPSADDGGGGLYDVDPSDTFDIDETGTWRIVVSTYDGVVSGYQLEVHRAG